MRTGILFLCGSYKLCVHNSYKPFMMLFGTMIKFIKTLGKLFAIGGEGVLFLLHLICGIWDSWLKLRK